ncbi:MAG: DNA methyltransferase [Betaproteobacteria bacterium]
MTAPTMHLDGKVILHRGDSRDVLAAMPDASVDSVVCDPPYALTQASRGGSPRGNDPATPFGRTKLGDKGFMGKQWDTGETAFDVAFWGEVLRVLKPGGHLLAFSGTRTYHRMACAIEDAGFEIRDQIQWVYGSGFPKSLDVSKAIDKAGGMSPREQSALLASRRVESGLSRSEVAALVGCTEASVRDWEDGRSRTVGRSIEWITPSDNYRARLADVLGYSSDERKAIGISIDRRGDGTVIGLGHSGQVRRGGNTETAKQWLGWGTALKPACEPICVARKPLIGTVAENVLTHRTGALNIDGCRIETAENLNGGAYAVNGNRDVSNSLRQGSGMNQAGKTTGKDYVQPAGRWPANIIHDGSDEVIACFPDSDGQQADISTTAPSPKTSNVYGKMNRECEASANRRYTTDGSTNFAALPGQRRGDAGSAARFFYTAKADAEDRLGSKHPTVKPLDLMQWLVRLVTPKGGVVLDPFAGTGTTGEAAWREGMKAILIERETEYQRDIERRMELAANPTKRAAVAASKNNLERPEDLPLFRRDA